jgi:hypothetical protein
MMTREDGDHKIIAHDVSEKGSVFNDLSDVERKLILDFIGFKSPIISVDAKEQALRYVEGALVKTL